MSGSMSQAAVALARFRDLLGADSVATGAAARSFQVDGLMPQCALFPATVEELRQCAGVADEVGWAVIPVGNGTRLGVGGVPRKYDVALSTRRLRRILAHEAADMTVTVEAGLNLGELNTALAAAGQRLPVDPPHPEQVTIGALIASDGSGPLRLSQGKVRDLLIGITVVLAGGTLISGGGRVVKNVAGYDLMKLFTGSFGSLGAIVEATFKIRPCPDHEAVLVIPVATTAAALGVALEVLAAPVTPLYVEALNRDAATRVGADGEHAVVVVGCGGTAAEIDTQMRRLQEQFADLPVRVCDAAGAMRLSAALRDFPSAPLGHDAGTRMCGCIVSLLPSRLGAILSRVEEAAMQGGFEVALLSHVGSGIASIRFYEAIAARPAFLSLAEWLRATIREAGGWVVFDLLPAEYKAQLDPWGFDTPALELMRGIKKTLDPNGRFSPGRFVGGI
jgi:glycolate oxidase FAD binding subunit